jgi:catechol 2,3-dioxygenase-like lactoylglutathione lyase family enzyme
VPGPIWHSQPVFDHVTVRVSDRGESQRFYDTVLGVLGVKRSGEGEWDDFGLYEATRSAPVTRRVHIGFVASSPELVDAFWQAGTDAGYMDDGRPGPRPRYGDDYYGGFLRDPDGNSVEAVHHDTLRRGGVIDHVWIRVGDLERSRAFYEMVGRHGGFREAGVHPDRVRFAGESGSFSIVAGRPTENLHMAFPGAPGAVDSFHREALAAGFEDNGAPGERPVYHAGYYAAFVRDPDGSNIEVVHHGTGGATSG